MDLTKKEIKRKTTFLITLIIGNVLQLFCTRLHLLVAWNPLLPNREVSDLYYKCDTLKLHTLVCIYYVYVLTTYVVIIVISIYIDMCFWYKTINSFEDFFVFPVECFKTCKGIVQ